MFLPILIHVGWKMVFYYNTCIFKKTALMIAISSLKHPKDNGMEKRLVEKIG